MQPDLEHELTQAGIDARAAERFVARPDAAFGEDLRARLMARYYVPARRFGFLSPLRFAPALLVAVLLAAAVLGAAGLRDPDPAPSATPRSSASPRPVPTKAALITPHKSAMATATPAATPVLTPEPTPAPAPPAPQPTPLPPPPKPEPTPVPTPSIGFMTLLATGCHGGVVLSWSPVADERFNHYTALRSTSPEIPAAYPPQGGAVDWGGTYILDPAVTSAVDSTLPFDAVHYYRAFAFDVEDQVIAATDAVAAKAKPTRALGVLDVAPDAGGTRLTWTPYDGPGACFTAYKLVYSTTDSTPSYAEGAAALGVVADQWVGTFVTDQLASGTTYYLRVQAFRLVAHGGPLLVGESDVATFTAP